LKDAAHAASCILLTRLITLIRIIGAALWSHQVRKRGKRGLTEMTHLAPKGLVTKKRQDDE